MRAAAKLVFWSSLKCASAGAWKQMETTMMEGRSKSFVPEYALEFIVDMVRAEVELLACTDIALAEQMNQFVVALMRDDGADATKIYHSEHALNGYCRFHHMLLGFAQKYPQFKEASGTCDISAVNSFAYSQIANKRVTAFKGSRDYRTKLRTPDLGHFLVLLALSDLSWPDVAAEFLQGSIRQRLLDLESQPCFRSRRVVRSSPEVGDPEAPGAARS